jgi:hypothetical protein
MTVHLGDEGLLTYVLAKDALKKGKKVSFVGRGTSMEPIIPDGTRMLWEPFNGQDIRPGMPLFCRFSRRHYSCHMAWVVTPDQQHILIGTTGAMIEGWVSKDQILGYYKGSVDDN